VALLKKLPQPFFLGDFGVPGDSTANWPFPFSPRGTFFPMRIVPPDPIGLLDKRVLKNLFLPGMVLLALAPGLPARADTVPDPATKIGNFYYAAPNGIAFIKDYAAAFVIDPGGSNNAGTVAPDDSFHRILFYPDAKKVVVLPRHLLRQPTFQSFRTWSNSSGRGRGMLWSDA
jgi:hypothetical protein